MKFDRLMIRYGELSVKGKNRRDFVNLLGRNLKNALADFESLKFEVKFDHIYIILNDENADKVIKIVKDIPGIHSFSLVRLIDPDIENIVNTLFEVAKNEQGKTFKVFSKRAIKSYPFRSEEIIQKVASKILKETNLKVDVHNPDIKLHLEIREEGCFIYTETLDGAGGFPLGSGGRVLLLLSGGIDSPVAGYYLLKRGMIIECVHFASPPYTSVAVIDKLKDILQKLTRYQEQIKLHVINFAKIQETIYANTDESYAITLMRRMMYRLADRIRIKARCDALGTGESVGQVASQTLPSLQVINEVTNSLILRPLITSDKEEIINVSKKIKTYDISIRPYEDCCTIFPNRRPKTRPTLSKCLEYENKVDYNSLIEETIRSEEVVIIKRDE